MKAINSNEIRANTRIFCTDTRTNLKGYINGFVDVLSVDGNYAVIQMVEKPSSMILDFKVSPQTINLTDWSFADTSGEFKAAALQIDTKSSESSENAFDEFQEYIKRARQTGDWKEGSEWADSQRYTYDLIMEKAKRLYYKGYEDTPEKAVCAAFKMHFGGRHYFTFNL